ncbi:MAG: hypothetical protein HY590_07780 [Candidatus Omnitrophica bacterium]|nr:hypothetical protein [Candidatus Omnitrophota bacterium]
MRRKGLFIFLGLMALLGTGCGVSKDKYLRLEEEKKGLERTVDQLTREKEDLARYNDDLQRVNQRLLQERTVKPPSPEESPLEGRTESEESSLK